MHYLLTALTAFAIVHGLSPTPPLQGLRAAVVGGGASGLLLAHRLLDAGAVVRIFEGRADPRSSDALGGRAYALGLGLRGRTAIRSVDEELWKSVKCAGFASDWFTLHLPFGAIDLRTPDPAREPSVLIYQTALCGALLDELEKRHSDRLRINFEQKVEDVDPLTGVVTAGATETFDLVAGCDGVNSATRAAIAQRCPGLVVERAELPGSLKVVRLDSMPPPLAPDAVHLVPGKGGLAAFLEPTPGGCCALLSWRPGEADPGAITDADEARLLLADSFPLIGAAFNNTAVGAQFVQQPLSKAATIRCNAYTSDRVALLGDAAHSTGGASGQGCNSVLQDAAALADALIEASGDVAGALETYAAARMPEGHALLDLSVGPTGALRRARFGLSAVVSSLLYKFGIGEPPLQTIFTTTLEPFAEIRRRCDGTFGAFPTASDFDAMRLKAVAAPTTPRNGRKTVRFARNSWDPPAPEAYYEVRFTAPRSFAYEGLGSTAAVADAGVTTTHRCSSLFEANALARRVLSKMPTLAIATFKISSDAVRLLDATSRAPVTDATDEWVGDYSDVVANAAAGVASPVGGADDRQAVWDDILQDLAEREAAEARTDVDEQWSAYLKTLQITKEIDAVVIGGVDGPAPCPLCNGKGVRAMFGKESTCEWCVGKGFVDDGAA